MVKNVDNFFDKLKKGIKKVGISLSSQAASSQVFSASSSLTTVFEMGTGVPWISSIPTSILYHACFILSSVFFNFFKIFLFRIFSEEVGEHSLGSCLLLNPQES